MGEFLTGLLYVVEIIVGLGLLIFVHELGHFLMAKLHKVRVEAFSLGFPPNLFARKWGETEYRIGMIPLGGYVKMAGEAVGEGKGDPDELTSKSAFARMQIFAAGALINLAVAFPLAMVASYVGRIVHYPQVSGPTMPETAAGMRPGDTILEVAGTKIESSEQYRQAMVVQSLGAAVPVKVRRLDGREEILQVRQSGSENHQPVPMITELAGVKEGSPAWIAGLRPEDQVIEVDGRPVFSVEPLHKALRAVEGEGSAAKTKAVTLKVGRPGELSKRIEDFRIHTFTITAPLAAEPEWYFPVDERVLEAIVGKVEPGYAASGILEEGDVIRRIGDRDVRSWKDLVEVIEPRGGERVKIVFERGGALQEKELLVGFRAGGTGQLGVPRKPSPRVAFVPDDGPLAGLLKTGDRIVSVEVQAPGGKIPPSKLDASGGEVSTLHLFRDAPPGSSMLVKVEGRGEAVRLEAKQRRVGDIAALGLDLTPVANDFYRQYPAGEAIRDGLREPVEMTAMTFRVLWKLVSFQESPKNLSGPLGIFNVSHASAKKGHGNFLWILVLITVNLGVFNLLPVPVLDGGHVLLLAIEKLRGRPNSVRFVEAFQITGLVLLLTLVVVVTFNDIRRW